MRVSSVLRSPESSGAHIAILAATSGHSGVDRLIRNLAPAFALRGHRVDVLQIDGHGPYWDSQADGVHLRRLGTAHVDSSLVPLVRYLREMRPNVLLTDKDRVNRLALVARRLAGVPTRLAVRIGTTVSKNLERRNPVSRWSQLASIRLGYRHADAIITPSHGAARDLATIAGLPVERISVLPNPVVDDEFERRAREPVDHPWFHGGGPPVVLGVGELSARKDFGTLLTAFSILRKTRDCRLVILGEGRKREYLEALTRKLSVGGDVDLPGFDPNPLRFMARSAAFALTSTCEGSGIVLVEALAVGTPVVSTDCPSGPREILQDGRYGILVPVANPAAVADALAATLDDPAPPEVLRKSVTEFNVRDSAGAYLRVLGVE